MTDTEMINASAYRSPGPVAERFIWDRSDVAFLQGPYGSGKTTACFFKMLTRAAAMPICRDGVKRYRGLVLRDTYRRMERTAIRSWHKWYPKTVGHWQGGQDRPSRHTIRLDTLDYPLEFEIEFAAVGDADVEDFMDGYEVTDLFLNAVNLQTEDVLTYGIGRVGRFPAEKDLPPGARYDCGVFGDLNAPDEDSWIYDRFFGSPTDMGEGLGGAAGAARVEYFRQPGGRAPEAENLQNLRGGQDYYLRLADVNKHQPWWVARMVDNKPGYSRDGEPVYPEFNDNRHVAPEPIKPVRGIPLRLAYDPGLQHPAGLIGQRMVDGQFRVIEEICPGRMGATRFGEYVRRRLDDDYPEFEVERQAADPAAETGADKEGGELTWLETVQAHVGAPISVCHTNEISARLDAVREQLTYFIDGDKPALLISPACKMLRRGFNSRYRYRKVQVAGKDRFEDKPEKNEYSHPHDALQYMVLDAIGRREATHGRKRRNRRPSGSVKAKTSFDIWSVGR